MKPVFNSSSSLFFLFIFVSWSSTILLLSHRVVAFSLNSEREALLYLFNRFSSASLPDSIKLSWNNLSSFNPPCEWSGVGCNAESTHIVSLNISIGVYGDFGQLGPEIGRLTYLKYVDLKGFNGSIPVELWNCSHLQYLKLDGNLFSGELPNDAVRNLHQLKDIDVSFNHLSGRIPESLFQISGLESVDLSFNNLTGSIPFNIGNATNMKNLRLFGNLLQGKIPTSIANCTKLEVLRMDGTGLSGEIPLGVWKIPTLAWIDVSSNNLSGELPVEMTELRHLNDIDLSDNHFSGLIPESLGINSTSLEFVSFRNNNFSGEIPPNLCFGKQLFYMDLSLNQFHGSIPPSYTGNCYTLRYLTLGENSLTGYLPHFGKNLSLYDLNISWNNIQGIPWSICNLSSSLSNLDLSENQMSGSLLPQCLGGLNNLALLDLRNNDLGGIVPNFTTDQLYKVDLNGNHFEGGIPRSMINCSSLKYLDLGNNQLNDTFPSFLQTLPYLQILVLRSNKLYGHLTRLLAFNAMKVLDISNNYFTGELPFEIGMGFQAMKYVDPVEEAEDFYYYPISTTIIHKGIEMRLNSTFMITFRAIDMSNNGFLGTIPGSIGQLSLLRMLNLSSNNLNGSIPSSLGNLTQLESLDLSQNKLSRRIPRHLTDIQSLSVLNLSHNNLTGRIPNGRQFQTFSNDSFSGNPGLCGFPLTMECGDGLDKERRQDPIKEKVSYEEDSNNPWNFTWEPVVIGYGCGVLIGLVLQYFIFTKAFLYRWFG